jgi:Protein of unknown function (DUF4089)
MTPSFDAEVYIEQAARALGLTILPEWRQTVVAHFAATAAAAELVLAFPLDDHDEPAPVFAP